MQFLEVVKGSLSDFNDFFELKENPGLTAFSNEQVPIAKARGKNKILVAHHVVEQPINSLKFFLFTLIVLGHEIAHCVNHHNTHQDRDARDSEAFEQWADFFGVRVALTLLTYGSFTGEAIASYGELVIPYASLDTVPDEVKADRLLRGLGDALALAHASIYSETDSASGYPNSADRALSVAAGVFSFFYRYFGNLPERWAWKLTEALIIGREWVDVDSHRCSNDGQIDASVQIMSDLHIKISENRYSITPGLKPKFRNLIDTHYIRTQLEKDINAAGLERTFSNWTQDMRQLIPATFQHR